MERSIRCSRPWAADETVALVVPSSNVGKGAQSVKATYKSLKKELQRFSRKIAHHRRGQVAEVDMPETQCVLIRRAPVRFPWWFQDRGRVDGSLPRPAKIGSPGGLLLRQLRARGTGRP